MADSSATPFELVRMDVAGHPVLVVYGELDIVNSPKLHEAISSVVDEKPSVLLVDMANVTFIDSSALGTLVVAHRHLAEAGGELRLVAVPESAARTLHVTGLTQRFTVFPDIHSATERADGREGATPKTD